ncbi:SpoIIE family protein phosphatase [Planosporangium thailandense]|uniref:SpoIIE family protein phosphatase n=1 Tax=Planosporangium thailandense TaxID=765197 RepID=A0ABX0Y410_9ACTN|nr:SpoIIE family protein phosphatase [Planosporangium thailandense]NJC72158.1 SpoIIE family protein phosphatase [Planosporangium thailandense]
MDEIRAGAHSAVAIDPGPGTADQGLGWGAWHLDTDHVEWSERLYRLTGRRQDDGALALPGFLNLAAPGDRGRVVAAVDRLFYDGAPVDIEYLMRAADRSRPIRATFELHRAHQTLYAVVNDLTELNRVRDRLLVSHRTVVAQQRALAQQREINGQLQQVILPVPTAVTELAGMRVAVRYLAADDTTEVGGDWYLALPVADGDVVFAVGDVVGHGLAAAPPMVALRHAATAYALAGHEPGEVLSALNLLLCRQGGWATATAVVARYRPRTGELTWARAGHPPIMLAGRGRVDTRYEPTGMLLGVDPTTGYEHASARLHPGDLVLMYTDGLIEQRGRGIDEGVRDLAERVGEGLAAPADDQLPSILDRLHRSNPYDDACMLAAQATASP